jgi:hypothetical protein
MVRHTKQRNTQRNTRRRGGAATAFPLSYFNGKAPFAADAGRNLLVAEGMGVRPKIGGKRSARSTRSARTKKRGGFVPSVMGNFMTSASKYIVPIALFAGYKMIKKNEQKSQKKRRTRRR